MAKYKSVGWAFVFSFLVWMAMPACAQNPDSLAMQRLEHNKTSGAESVRDLALLLQQALQQTNFDVLSPHVVDKLVYDKMLLVGPLAVQEALVLYSPSEMQFDMQKGFGRVLQDGMALEATWPGIALKSILADTASPHNALIFPVTLILSSPGTPDIKLQFSAARLDGRFYFMPPLFIVNEDLD